MFSDFALDKVKVNDQYFAFRKELVKKYIIEFDIDRLMHTFKLNAGIPSDAKPLGGWEAPDCGLRGHFVGHFLSACSKFASSEKDEILKIKAYQIVDIMELCAKTNGYLSAFGEEVLDVLEQEENRNVWAPYYTLHKVMQGLVDCYVFLNNKKALKLAVNLAHYIKKRFDKLSYWKIDGILHCTKLNPVNEFGGIGDVLYTLYDITKDDELLKLANIFDRDYFINNLAEGRDVLTDLHANTHLPMVIAAMHRYLISSENEYKMAAENFYSFLKGRTFVNGNNSSKAAAGIVGQVSEKSEHWGNYGMLADALTGGESESCCAHNTERILNQLFKCSGEVEYLEHMELLKYNSILNCSSNETGLSQYHQPMGTGAVKKFSSKYDDFLCCTASGIEAMSEVQKNIWFKNENSILLNAFISSVITWDEKRVRIFQHTEFPDNLISRLTVEAAEPVDFSLLIKESSVDSIKINNSPIELNKVDGYIVLNRIFHNQDRIEIKIKSHLFLVPLQGSKDLAAIMYGKVLLAQIGQCPCVTGLTNYNINQKLIKSNSDKLEFFMDDLNGNRSKFIPLFRVEGETYTVYMNITGNSIQNNVFSVAKDGSSAYEE